MAQPVRHRQTKGAATDMLSLPPPRHISTLPAPDTCHLRCRHTPHGFHLSDFDTSKRSRDRRPNGRLARPADTGFGKGRHAVVAGPGSLQYCKGERCP